MPDGFRVVIRRSKDRSGRAGDRRAPFSGCRLRPVRVGTGVAGRSGDQRRAGVPRRGTRRSCTRRGTGERQRGGVRPRSGSSARCLATNPSTRCAATCDASICSATRRSIQGPRRGGVPVSGTRRDPDPKSHDRLGRLRAAGPASIEAVAVTFDNRQWLGRCGDLRRHHLADWPMTPRRGGDRVS
jgi:hypothetical protein